jgi:uncharacterized protein YndB with AHSA1/START domain
LYEIVFIKWHPDIGYHLNSGIMKKNKADDLIHIETIIHASMESVWRAWTDPGLILKWYGSDPNGAGVSAHVDLRPGGNYEISFRGSEGTTHTCFGVYKEVAVLSRLVFSWQWKSEPGVESQVTVILSPDGDHTLMLFEHAHVGNKSAHNYEAGWQDTFVKLERLLNTRETEKRK